MVSYLVTRLISIKCDWELNFVKDVPDYHNSQSFLQAFGRNLVDLVQTPDKACAHA